jgi:hypothetical protein
MYQVEQKQQTAAGNIHARIVALHHLHHRRSVSTCLERGQPRSRSHWAGPRLGCDPVCGELLISPEKTRCVGPNNLLYAWVDTRAEQLVFNQVLWLTLNPLFSRDMEKVRIKTASRKDL